ncbi:MAG: hypothetical protein ACJA0Q_000498 [Saprospiraceae bacterium]|jgi:hypothetical protein
MGFLDNFEKTLKDFFFAKHPRQIKKIPEIIKEFKGREQDVMLHLCEKYKVSPSTIDGLSSYSAPAPIVEEKVTEVAAPEEPAEIENEAMDSEQEETVEETNEEDENEEEEEK